MCHVLVPRTLSGFRSALYLSEMKYRVKGHAADMHCVRSKQTKTEGDGRVKQNRERGRMAQQVSTAHMHGSVGRTEWQQQFARVVFGVIPAGRSS